MADEEGAGAPYKLVKEDGTEVDTSRHYNGKAIATYPNGDTYDGFFVGGLRDGPNGVYTYSQHKDAEEVADTYKGAWKENLKHGIGK
jgi:hypothetical protein